MQRREDKIYRIGFAASEICKRIVLVGNWMPPAHRTWMEAFFFVASHFGVFATISNWKQQLEWRKNIFSSSASRWSRPLHPILTTAMTIIMVCGVGIALIYLWHFYCVLCRRSGWRKYVSTDSNLSRGKYKFIFYSCSQHPPSVRKSNATWNSQQFRTNTTHYYAFAVENSPFN